MMYRLLRPLLFRLDSETAHRFTLQLLRLVGGFSPARRIVSALCAAPQNPVKAFGLVFRNPVGLAAGYDKDAVAWRGLAALGFGHIELGTVTPLPQPGNDRPRLFRLPEDGALVNRLGFPSRGADYVAARLRNRRRGGVVLGVNIGVNRDTPVEEAARDYLALLRKFAPLSDYLTVNVSSPNTAGLRQLQARDALENLLGELAKTREEGPRIPILVKLSPDLETAELDDAVGAILGTGMDGIVATNTTVARPGLQSGSAGERGGLSGRPLGPLSLETLEKIVARVEGAVPVVAAGGILGPDDARRRLDAGAALVQVYTGLVYRGPGLVKEILKK
ncbi:MAG TPA: quinone-dependent dihydroorotate dehydrogenase [Anaerolineales bacterium]|nr:quinone-dependent dihydroorotate dehydrogenase [Anaerolineales bacterium]